MSLVFYKYSAKYLNGLSVGALPQDPKSFFVLTQKSNPKKSRLNPLHSKNLRLTAKIF
jgi:hypothetical protein